MLYRLYLSQKLPSFDYYKIPSDKSNPSVTVCSMPKGSAHNDAIMGKKCYSSCNGKSWKWEQWGVERRIKIIFSTRNRGMVPIIELGGAVCGMGQ